MGEFAEQALADSMKHGQRGSGFPQGYMSERVRCCECGRPIAGRLEGMRAHMQAFHRLSYPSATLLALHTLNAQGGVTEGRDAEGGSGSEASSTRSPEGGCAHD